VVAPAIVGGLALTGVAAAATGTVPDPVRDRFREAVGWGHTPDVDPAAAHLIASASFDGATYEYWISEGADGGRCEYLRFLRDGEPDNGPRMCLDDDDGPTVIEGYPDFYVTGGSAFTPDVMLLAGRVPKGSAVVVVTLDDGTELRQHVPRDRFFLLAGRTPGPAVVVGRKPLRSLVAYDDEGRVVARRDY
jgi:hypothetical protein